MSKQFYLIITQTEDGTYIKKRATKEDVLRFLNDNEPKTILDDLPEFHDGYFQQKGTVILKAEVVNPKPVTTVTQYEI